MFYSVFRAEVNWGALLEIGGIFLPLQVKSQVQPGFGALISGNNCLWVGFLSSVQSNLGIREVSVFSFTSPIVFFCLFVLQRAGRIEKGDCQTLPNTQSYLVCHWGAGAGWRKLLSDTLLRKYPQAGCASVVTKPILSSRALTNEIKAFPGGSVG